MYLCRCPIRHPRSQLTAIHALGCPGAWAKAGAAKRSEARAAAPRLAVTELRNDIQVLQLTAVMLSYIVLQGSRGVVGAWFETRSGERSSP
jgi:hypothetical protein